MVLSAFCGLLIVASEPGIGLGEANLTLQNQKIMCWGRSFTISGGGVEGGAYPDHLGRVLGRETERLLTGQTIGSSLGVVGDFNDEYGIIIYQFSFMDFRSGVPWDTTERHLRNMIRDLEGTGAVVVIFEAFPVWEVEGELTALHYLCFTGTSEELRNPDFMKVTVGNETRIEKYYEMWGETLVSEIAMDEGAYFIPAYETWDCLDLCSGMFSCCDLPFQTKDIDPGYSWHPSSASLTHIHDELDRGDHLHLNAVGNGVFAERVARYMVDWGLGEYAMSYEDMAQDLSSLYSVAEETMEFIEDMGIALHEPRKRYEIAKSLEENGYVYTARWVLEERLMPGLPDPVRLEDTLTMLSDANATIASVRKAGMDNQTITGLLGCLDSAESALYELDLNSTEMYLQQILNTTNWQNISTMFARAQEDIKALEEAGDRRAFVAKGDYDRAVKAFDECDHEIAIFYLEKIPEAVYVCVFALLVLGLFGCPGCRRFPTRFSSECLCGGSGWR